MRGDLAILGLAASVAMFAVLPWFLLPLAVWIATLSVVAIVDTVRGE